MIIIVIISSVIVPWSPQSLLLSSWFQDGPHPPHDHPSLRGIIMIISPVCKSFPGGSPKISCLDGWSYPSGNADWHHEPGLPLCLGLRLQSPNCTQWTSQNYEQNSPIYTYLAWNTHPPMFGLGMIGWYWSELIYYMNHMNHTKIEDAVKAVWNHDNPTCQQLLIGRQLL